MFRIPVPRRSAMHVSGRRRGLALVMLLIASPVVLLAGALTVGTSAVAAPAPRTVVSLTFDDGRANQMAAAPILAVARAKATFFVTSGFIGADGYLTRDQLTALALAGHEIGGHTVSHPDLAAIPLAEVRRQLCTDRATLASWGFAVRSFAYPFASSTPEVEQAVRDCGYRSARMLGDLTSRFGCASCDPAETMPPGNPFYTRALDQVDRTWTLADLKAGVTRAEARGGWVQFTFHDVCATSCGDLAVTPQVLRQFVTWLAPRALTRGTVVQTVGDTIGGSVAPVVTVPDAPAPGPGVNGVVNPGLEEGGGEIPSCWMRGGWGTNTPSFTVGAPARTGAVASSVTVSGHVSGDAKLLPQFDLGTCSPTVTPGRTYSLRAWYISTSVTQYAVYLRTRAGVWQYWTSSPWFASSDAYVQASWVTPAIPDGYTGLSFGLSAFTDGTVRSDDYELFDVVGAPPLSSAAVSVPPGIAGVTAARRATGPVEVTGPTESTLATVP